MITCLESIKAQTLKDFECIIVDDESTDNSGKLCDEFAKDDDRYPHIIKPIYETENQWGKGTIGKTMDAAMNPNSKFIALCEGDDYRTDPTKLPKQVDVMEADEEIGLVQSAVDIYNQTSELFIELARGVPLRSLLRMN